MSRMIRADGTMRVCLIKPGWGSSGFYSAEVLRRDGPKAFPAKTFMYANHPSRTEEADRPERDVRDLWSVLTTDAQYLDNGPKGAGLYADVKVLPAFAPYAEALAPHIGCSIRALGRASTGEREGRKGPIIEALVSGRSCDWVTVPGAGGGAVELFEAARDGRPMPEATHERTDHMGDQQDTRLLNEAEALALREAMTGMERRLAEAEAGRERVERELAMREAQQALAEELRGFKLNDASYQHLVEQLTSRLPFDAAQRIDRKALPQLVKEAVAAHIEFLAAATGMRPGQIHGMGLAVRETEALQEARQAQEQGFTRLMGADKAKIAAAGR